MKSVGERIRQARDYRGLTGEDLAIKVDYKTQSGISNLENRTTGNGGNKLPRIAEVLNFSLEWFMQGPDCDDMATVPPYRPHSGLSDRPKPGNHSPRVSDLSPARYLPARTTAHQLVDLISDAGLEHCLDVLKTFAERYPAQRDQSAGLPLPAHQKRAA